MRQERFDTPGMVEVVVDNKLGDVRLRTHAEAAVEVELRAHGSRGDEIVGRSRVEQQNADGNERVIVEVPHPGGFLWREGTDVVVTVRLPEGALVDVGTVSGTVTGEGRLGGATVRSTSGDVSLGRLDGDLVARTTSGDITVGSIAGDADIETASGSVRCEAIAQTGFVKTASGDVDVGSAARRLTVETTSGDVSAGRLDDGCDVKTISGDQRCPPAPRGRGRVPNGEWRHDYRSGEGHSRNG